MPIDYSKYPPNWLAEIRPRILKRADNCCENENCRVRNGSIRMGRKGPYKIVLTIAHLDHDEENWNVSDDRLRAWCQVCHLKYDISEKKRRREEKTGQTKLFDIDK